MQNDDHGRGEHVATAGMDAGVGLIMTNQIHEGARFDNRYHVECFDKNGKLKWIEDIHNLVTTEGLTDTLAKYFKGAAYTASWFVGLKGTGSMAAGDTLASHAGWTEITAYTGTRQALTLNTPAAGSTNNSASKAVFTMNGSATVFGAFVASVTSGTAGILYSGADFSASRAVVSSDVLNVTVTLTQS
jgi:hypothetical protein